MKYEGGFGDVREASSSNQPRRAGARTTARSRRQGNEEQESRVPLRRAHSMVVEYLMHLAATIKCVESRKT